MSPVSTCDLHLHTCYSDGRPSPEELLRYAAGAGMRTIAITDHDNARGSREAASLAADLGIELIPAIELTCRWDACQLPAGQEDIDVLGYFVDLDRPSLQAREREALADIHERVGSVCASLTAAGWPVTLEEALAENPRYAGYQQVAQALVRKGLAAGWWAGRELMAPHLARIRPSRFTIDQMIAAVCDAGGVAVLAHPTVAAYRGRRLEAPQVAELIEMGLGGIEVYHHALDDEARRHFLALARQLDLAVTGGSDDHGWPAGFPYLGSQPVTGELVEALRARWQRAQRL